jgi:hypothetical protein
MGVFGIKCRKFGIPLFSQIHDDIQDEIHRVALNKMSPQDGCVTCKTKKGGRNKCLACVEQFEAKFKEAKDTFNKCNGLEHLLNYVDIKVAFDQKVLGWKKKSDVTRKKISGQDALKLAKWLIAVVCDDNNFDNFCKELKFALQEPPAEDSKVTQLTEQVNEAREMNKQLRVLLKRKKAEISRLKKEEEKRLQEEKEAQNLETKELSIELEKSDAKLKRLRKKRKRSESDAH